MYKTCVRLYVQVAKKAVTAAGYLCRGEQAAEILDLLVNALMDTASVKSDILPFAVGEALCFAFGGKHLLCLLTAIAERWRSCASCKS
jgi:hypothetical protein